MKDKYEADVKQYVPINKCPTYCLMFSRLKIQEASLSFVTLFMQYALKMLLNVHTHELT